MAQASRTQHLAEQDAFKWTLGLKPSAVIMNAAITFAEPKNSSGSKKTRHVRVCLYQGKRLLWPPLVHFLKQVPANSRFSLPGLGSVLFGHLPALRDLTPGRHFLLCRLNLLLLLWFSRCLLRCFGQRAVPLCSLCPMNLPWHISPSTVLKVNVILC